jgi:hypothetical protein
MVGRQWSQAGGGAPCVPTMAERRRNSLARTQCARPANACYLIRRGTLVKKSRPPTHVEEWAWEGGGVGRRTTATPVARRCGGRTRGTSGVGEKGGEGGVQCPCTCHVEPVGPAVAAGHRQLRPIGRRRGRRGHGARRRAWARTPGPGIL